MHLDNLFATKLTFVFSYIFYISTESKAATSICNMDLSEFGRHASSRFPEPMEQAAVG